MPGPGMPPSLVSGELAAGVLTSLAGLEAWILQSDLVAYLDAQHPLAVAEDADVGDALDRGEAGHVDRQRLAELRQLLDLAGLDVLDDLPGDGLADRVDPLDGVPTIGDQVLDRPRRVADVLGGLPVGPGLVLHVPGFEEVGELLQSARHLVVAAHRATTTPVGVPASVTVPVSVTVPASGPIFTVPTSRCGPPGRRCRRPSRAPV